MSPRTFRITASLLFLALALLIALAACRSTAPGEPTPEPPSEINEVVDVWLRLSESEPTTKDIAIVQVWNSLSQQFVERDTIDAATLGEAAIEAMLDAERDADAALDPTVLSGVAIDAMLEVVDDPYTLYLDPEQYDRYLESSKGEFEGIGARVDLIDGRLTVVAPISDTPC